MQPSANVPTSGPVDNLENVREDELASKSYVLPRKDKGKQHLAIDPSDVLLDHNQRSINFAEKVVMSSAATADDPLQHAPPSSPNDAYVDWVTLPLSTQRQGEARKSGRKAKRAKKRKSTKSTRGKPGNDAAGIDPEKYREILAAQRPRKELPQAVPGSRVERACVLDLKDGQSVLVEPPSALAKREAQKALKLQMQEEKLLETQKRRQKERLELEKKLEAEQRQQFLRRLRDMEDAKTGRAHTLLLLKETAVVDRLNKLSKEKELDIDNHIQKRRKKMEVVQSRRLKTLSDKAKHMEVQMATRWKNMPRPGANGAKPAQKPRSSQRPAANAKRAVLSSKNRWAHTKRVAEKWDQMLQKKSLQLERTKEKRLQSQLNKNIDANDKLKRSLKTVGQAIGGQSETGTEGPTPAKTAAESAALRAAKKSNKLLEQRAKREVTKCMVLKKRLEERKRAAQLNAQREAQKAQREAGRKKAKAVLNVMGAARKPSGAPGAARAGRATTAPRKKRAAHGAAPSKSTVPKPRKHDSGTGSSRWERTKKEARARMESDMEVERVRRERDLLKAKLVAETNERQTLENKLKEDALVEKRIQMAKESKERMEAKLKVAESLKKKLYDQEQEVLRAKRVVAKSKAKRARAAVTAAKARAAKALDGGTKSGLKLARPPKARLQTMPQWATGANAFEESSSGSGSGPPPGENSAAAGAMPGLKNATETEPPSKSSGASLEVSNVSSLDSDFDQLGGWDELQDLLSNYYPGKQTVAAQSSTENLNGPRRRPLHKTSSAKRNRTPVSKSKLHVFVQETYAPTPEIFRTGTPGSSEGLENISFIDKAKEFMPPETTITLEGNGNDGEIAPTENWSDNEVLDGGKGIHVPRMAAWVDENTSPVSPGVVAHSVDAGDTKHRIDFNASTCDLPKTVEERTEIEDCVVIES
jgi:hypothetical protein